MVAHLMDARSIRQDGQTVNCTALRFRDAARMGGTPQTQLPKGMQPRDVAPRLVAAREALGMKPSEIADAIEVDRSAWTKYEKALRPIPVDVAHRLAERFGLTLDFIFRGRLDGIEDRLRGPILSRLATK